MKQKTNKTKQKGFTLIELLVVIGILALLLAITLIAINPARQFSQANDTKRSSDVNAILNAINQYGADHKGQLPASIGTSSVEISTTGINICEELVTEYLAALPSDPTGTMEGDPITDCTNYSTGYSVFRSAENNRLTVSAVGEITPLIQVTR